MIKAILSTATILAISAGSSLAQPKQGSINNSKTPVKFLEEISVEPATIQATNEVTASNWKAEYLSAQKKELPAVTSSINIENAHQLQFKFSVLLDTEVEEIQNMALFQLIDEWLGTRYRLGGTDKSGIDCSAFVQTIFSNYYRIALPRTAREQYAFSHKLSRTDLKEGDLVFFNTTGGVSHVGMYLMNNKFVHASSSGVTISDLYDDYWIKRFIGVGRVEDTSVLVSSKL
jgi:lipoprotein Spr